MDAASQWPQDIVMKPILEEISRPCSVEIKMGRPHKEQALNCPRCNSINTKFCYYNNYSLSQPRYFCKACKRYWTEGGSLRNIPVGGGSRKCNKRSSSSSSSCSTSSYSSCKKLTDSQNPRRNNDITNNNNNILEKQDLNLGYSNHADLKVITERIQVSNFENSFSGGVGIREMNMSEQQRQNPNSSMGFDNSYEFMPSTVVTPAPASETRSTVFGSRFPNLPEFKISSLNFSLDHDLVESNSYRCFHHETNENDHKLLFPFEDLKQQQQDHSSNTTNNNDIGDQQDGDPSAGYWNGVIGGGSW
ncbi:hypothetical protein OROGR_010479 [Orobanche gracilis]